MPQVFSKKEPAMFANRRYGERLYRKDGGGGRHPSWFAHLCRGHLSRNQGLDGSRLSGFQGKRRYVPPQGWRCRRGGTQGGSNSCLRCLKPFFPDQRNDRARFVVLEYWLRP